LAIIIVFPINIVFPIKKHFIYLVAMKAVCKQIDKPSIPNKRQNKRQKEKHLLFLACSQFQSFFKAKLLWIYILFIF